MPVDSSSPGCSSRGRTARDSGRHDWRYAVRSSPRVLLLLGESTVTGRTSCGRGVSVTGIRMVTNALGRIVVSIQCAISGVMGFGDARCRLRCRSVVLVHCLPSFSSWTAALVSCRHTEVLPRRIGEFARSIARGAWLNFGCPLNGDCSGAVRNGVPTLTVLFSSRLFYGRSPRSRSRLPGRAVISKKPEGQPRRAASARRCLSCLRSRFV
jgi:hypothetical protein